MKFNVILNSQSTTGYDIPDEVFTGVRDGLLCGWSLEAINRDGKFGWATVTFAYGTPEDAYENVREYWDLIGLKPTGNAVFRGYYKEVYDFEERDYFMRKVA